MPKESQEINGKPLKRAPSPQDTNVRSYAKPRWTWLCSIACSFSYAQVYTPNFTVTAGAHTLAFVTGAGGDSDVIDSVVITHIGPASIFTFGLPGNLATILGTDIAWTVPYSSDLANLAPTYTMSAGAKGSPASGAVVNFTAPKTYTTTSADSTVTNVYTVTVTKAPPRSDKSILTFGLPGNAASITGTNIVLSMPYGTDVTALAPTYTVSPGASGSPGSGISRNFTTPKTYTIIAEDGSTKVYLVTVLVNSASGLIGHWVSGATNLADTSGFTSPGTHDGVAVGAAATLAWSTDVPSGFSGQSLDLRAGSVGVLITNTAVNDANYKPTFDEGIASKFTAAFWFKGSLAGTWVGKSGNTPIGWKTRQLSAKADFTIRNNGLGEAAASSLTSSNAVDDGNWHHMAAVFDSTASFRRIYIDGVLQAQVTGTPYAVTFTNVSHLILGANQGNVVDVAIGSFFPGLLYDVRMYNYPLSAAEVANVYSPGLIGHWVSGETNLTDTSGFTPPGTHDGVAVGASATLAWSSDVPAGFTGESLDLRAGSVGVLITNSAVNDANYRTTFDEGISNKFTAAFWFKGPLSGTWVGKSGNTPIGWKTRPLSPKADFTMRNNGLGEVGYASSLTSSNAVDDGNWHHMAAVFDGTASFRKIYVDGVLQAQATGTPYAVTFTNVSHLLVGANQGNVVDAAIGSFFPGQLYDVRMYNYSLSAAEVASVYTPGPDILGIKGPVAGKFTISASENGAGMVVTEKTTSLVAPIVW